MLEGTRRKNGSAISGNMYTKQMINPQNIVSQRNNSLAYPNTKLEFSLLRVARELPLASCGLGVLCMQRSENVLDFLSLGKVTRATNCSGAHERIVSLVYSLGDSKETPGAFSALKSHLLNSDPLILLSWSFHIMYGE